MLTTERREDIEPYHNRQIVILPPMGWALISTSQKPNYFGLFCHPIATLHSFGSHTCRIALKLFTKKLTSLLEPKGGHFNVVSTWQPLRRPCLIFQRDGHSELRVHRDHSGTSQAEFSAPRYVARLGYHRNFIFLRVRCRLSTLTKQKAPPARLFFSNPRRDRNGARRRWRGLFIGRLQPSRTLFPAEVLVNYYIGILASVFALPAAAADLPSYKAPPTFITPARVDTWTGFYAGVNLGYGFSGGKDSGEQTYYSNASGDTGTETHGPGGPAWNTGNGSGGVLGGAQIGYNYQVSPLLVTGIETDVQGASLSSNSSATDTTHIALLPAGGDANSWPVQGNEYSNTRVNWYGTSRGRLGITALNDSLLAYATGGLAYGNVSQSFTYTGGFLADAALGFGGSHWDGSVSGSQTRVGWTAGAGLEWKIPTAAGWSIKAEYLYTDLGSATLGLSAPAYRNSNGTGGRTVEAVNSSDVQWHTVRVGLNYHFN
jgi:outer membrane immunogenic protein